MSADNLDSADFPQYLDSLLTVANMSNTDLQRASGVHHSLIQKWRSGKAKPSLDRLRPIADALRIPRTVMFVRAGLMRPDDVALPPLYIDLAEFVERLPVERRNTMHAHIRLLCQAAASEVKSGSQSPEADTG